MQRYFIELSYNGSPYFGWQKQPNEISVQETIEIAIQTIYNNSSLSVVGCGRTDTGVHAKFFVLHVELPLKWSEEEITYKLNKILPESIAILKTKMVDQHQHARFSAIERTYRYFIHSKKDPFKTNKSLFHPTPLNINLMNEACTYLLGQQDFTSLSKLHTDVATNICKVSHCGWTQIDETNFYFEIIADRFLRNMVRASVGTLIEIGKEKIKPSDLKHILAAKNRSKAKTSVSAHGLYLWNITY